MILKEHPEYLGTHPLCNSTTEQLAAGELPVLIKFIDAKEGPVRAGAPG